jgi:death-on-curing family protein
MPGRRTTVADLAAAVEADLDEAMVLLWDAGLEHIRDPSDLIPVSMLKQARTALGLAAPRALGTAAYWQGLLGLGDLEFADLLRQLDIHPAPKGRRLPKGAIKQLKRLARERLGDVDVVPPPEEPSSPAPPPLKWEPVGHEQPIRYLTADEIRGIHECLEADFAGTDDPIEPAGVRDQNLLDSAAFRPLTSLGESLKYPTVEMAAAALFHSVALNHAFHNGNKRTALVTLLVFLDENGMQLTCGEDDLFKLVLLVAQHRIIPRTADERPDREALHLAGWIRSNSRRQEQGERVLKWVRLRRILAAFSCELESPGGVGNRINIQRKVVVPSRIGRTRATLLTTQVFYAGDGTDVERNTAAKIRRDLHLDDEHGVDSRSFYGMEVRATQDFIVIYRKSLGRLARL